MHLKKKKNFFRKLLRVAENQGVGFPTQEVLARNMDTYKHTLPHTYVPPQNGSLQWNYDKPFASQEKADPFPEQARIPAALWTPQNPGLVRR